MTQRTESTKGKVKELDFCLMLDGHNLTGTPLNPRDICTVHHHYWHTRETYLIKGFELSK